jgi:hypothetical protein
MSHRQSFREKRELERISLVALGLVADQHVDVSKIEFRMTYFRRGLDRVLMTRTLRFSSTDYARFHMKCMEDGCTSGGFDLGPIVAGLAKAHKKTAKGKIYCHGRNLPFGHASLAYEVNLQYHSKAVQNATSKKAERSLSLQQ